MPYLDLPERLEPLRKAIRIQKKHPANLRHEVSYHFTFSGTRDGIS
jgi:hypothetical protein